VISNEANIPEERFAAVAHEMYHRVTASRNDTLRQFMWIDEMLARLAEWRLLSEHGMGKYVTSVMQAFEQEEQAMSSQQLQVVRPKRSLLIWTKKTYPPGFTSGVARLGRRLDRLVGWEQMRRMVHCHTWEEWMSLLSRV
jgi:hypothetical protein